MPAGSSTGNDIDAVKEMRAWFRSQAPDALGESGPLALC
jgi:hypothetical protein